MLCSYCNPSIGQKTKENEIKKLLEENNYDFSHDKHCSAGWSCSKYRPDFLFDREYYYVIIEVDENAHKNYDQDCEKIRMNNIVDNLGLPVMFIRYNPDNRGVPKKECHKRLLETLDKCLYEYQELYVNYLFY